MEDNFERNMAVESAESFLAACDAGGATCARVALDAVQRTWPKEVDLIAVCEAANALVLAAAGAELPASQVQLFGLSRDDAGEVMTVWYESVKGTRVIPTTDGCYISNQNGDGFPSDYYRYQAARRPALSRKRKAAMLKAEAEYEAGLNPSPAPPVPAWLSSLGKSSLGG